MNAEQIERIGGSINKIFFFEKSINPTICIEIAFGQHPSIGYYLHKQNDEQFWNEQ